MGKILIVRHGQDEDNANLILNGRRDKPLTDVGRKQAEKVAQKLKPLEINIIYSSPLLRAYQTAEIIAQKIGIKKIIKNTNLVERDFGVLTGRPLTDIPKFSKNILEIGKIKYFLDAKGAESFESVYQRAQKVLKEINSKHKNANILIVAHSDIGKMIRAVYRTWTWEKGLKMPYFDNAGVIELPPKADVAE
jgi:broad specificity phosphatase PhoE